MKNQISIAVTYTENAKTETIVIEGRAATSPSKANRIIRNIIENATSITIDSITYSDDYYADARITGMVGNYAADPEDGYMDKS